MAGQERRGHIDALQDTAGAELDAVVLDLIDIERFANGRRRGDGKRPGVGEEFRAVLGGGRAEQGEVGFIIDGKDLGRGKAGAIR